MSCPIHYLSFSRMFANIALIQYPSEPMVKSIKLELACIGLLEEYRSMGEDEQRLQKLDHMIQSALKRLRDIIEQSDKFINIVLTSGRIMDDVEKILGQLGVRVLLRTTDSVAVNKMNHLTLQHLNSRLRSIWGMTIDLE